MTSMLRKLSRAAIRYGVQPEHIGPISVFVDDDYLAEYLTFMKRWKAPSTYGCTAKHREKARREWDKLILKIQGPR
jgi:hypothetical protein